MPEACMLLYHCPEIEDITMYMYSVIYLTLSLLPATMDRVFSDYLPLSIVVLYPVLLPCFFTKIQLFKIHLLKHVNGEVLEPWLHWILVWKLIT